MNYGLILDDIIPEDLLFGENTRVQHNISVEDLNWLPLLSKGELQKIQYETMGCVSFSALNVLEGVMNYHLRNNLLSEGNVAWLTAQGYLNAEGDFDCSDCFTTAMSGTSNKGNTGRRVWNSMRNDGIVPEKVYPWNGQTADEYRDPSRIPQSVKDLGLEFKKRFDVQYETIAKPTEEKFKKALKSSPIQVFIATTCPIEQGIQQACGNTTNHAVSMIDDTDPRNYYPLFDQYIRQPNATGQEKFIRKVAKDFSFYITAFTCTVTEKEEQPEDMNTFVKVLKDSQGKTTGFFLPAINEDAIVNLAKHYQKEVPRKADGSIDWANFVEGTYTLDK